MKVLLRSNNFSIVAFIFGILFGILLSRNLLQPSKHIEMIKNVLNINRNFLNDVEFSNANEVLNEKVRILCWVMTNPKNEYKWKHIEKLWGDKCTKIVFMSSQTKYHKNKNIEVVGVSVGNDSRDTLWGKTKEAFIYAFRNYLDDYDWFMKMDDDTYLIYENLQNLLYKYDTNLPLLLGHRYLIDQAKRGYMAGMSYILSRKALQIFHDQLMSNQCRKDGGGAEDLEMGICLANSTIQVDVRDDKHKHTFFPVSPQDALDPFGKPYWYQLNQFYKIDIGLNCCSDAPISFHYIAIDNMYLMEYLFYKVQPFGVSDKYDAEKLPGKASINQMLLNSLNIRYQ